MDFEVIVVDNGSRLIPEHYKEQIFMVKIIALNENTRQLAAFHEQ